MHRVSMSRPLWPRAIRRLVLAAGLWLALVQPSHAFTLIEFGFVPTDINVGESLRVWLNNSWSAPIVVEVSVLNAATSKVVETSSQITLQPGAGKLLNFLPAVQSQLGITVRVTLQAPAGFTLPSNAANLVTSSLEFITRSTGNVTRVLLPYVAPVANKS